ncbi:MAG: hypothetical protein H0W36_00695 [Gemmatimonadetes bacterium]|nr:hypothetical protein [Gemmatimonadota bacterium]
MGTTFTATSKAAEAPNVEEGMYDARFDGTSSKRVKGGLYTKDTENGDLKLEWTFTLLDDEGAELFDGGDPIELSKLTGIGFNIASKTIPQEVRILKALLTGPEYAKFEAGEGVDEEAMAGRKCQVEVFVKENGWPGIGNVIAARKSRSSAKSVE